MTYYSTFKRNETLIDLQHGQTLKPCYPYMFSLCTEINQTQMDIVIILLRRSLKVQLIESKQDDETEATWKKKWGATVQWTWNFDLERDSSGGGKGDSCTVM
jgi:hypothetical protein